MEDTKKDAVKNEIAQEQAVEKETTLDEEVQEHSAQGEDLQNKEAEDQDAGKENPKKENVQAQNVKEEAEQESDVQKENAETQTEKYEQTEVEENNSEKKKSENEESAQDEDDDQAYEQRRATRMERLRRRKRRRRNTRIAVGTLAVCAVAAGVGGKFYGEELKGIVQKQQVAVSDFLEKIKEDRQQKESLTAEAGTQEETQNAEEAVSRNQAEEETQKEGEAQTEGNQSGTDDQQNNAEKLSAEDKKIYRQAKHYAAQYDYDKAIETLKTSAIWETNARFQKAIRVYEKKKASCVSWPIEEVTHVFYHTLIVDTARAFDGDYKSGDYDQVMTTIDEFNKITQNMYEKGYVMVSLYDMATADENGNMTQGEILLPPGKVPFVLSQDDVCYYHYMDGDGFASKLVVDEDGKIRNEYVEEDGTVSVGDYDLVPLIDRFVEEHPDFSYHGAKGIVALTGYNGILGYRTDSSYETRPADLDDNKVQWLNEHPDFDLNKEREEASTVAQAMKDEGWLFASHTWGHQDVSKISQEKLQADTQKFKENVDPLIGGTDIIIFAFGADLTGPEDYSGEKFEYLKGQGYNYYCNVDSRQYFVQLRSNYLRQGRRNLDGYRMYYNPDLLTDLFDAQEVFDSARPVPVPPMG